MVDAMHGMEAMDAMHEMDVMVGMQGAEMTTAMNAHQELRKHQQFQKNQEGGGAQLTSEDDHVREDGDNDNGPGDNGDDDDEKKQKPENCYSCFFGTSRSAVDGTHSTGNKLLDRYYAGDPAHGQDKIIIKHNSIERKLIYYAFAWLWCGCWEPKYKMTNKYAIGEEWKCCPQDKACTCCVKITDSMAYENVEDLQKRQTCWYGCLSCFGCCCRKTCACNDMADIVLIGSDDSHPDGWKLRRIRDATKLFNEISKIVQDTQKDIAK